MSKTQERLVVMANQIARAFARYPRDQAVAQIAAHIKSFWEQRMLAQIFAYIDAGGAGLEETALLALASMR